MLLARVRPSNVPPVEVVVILPVPLVERVPLASVPPLIVSVPPVILVVVPMVMLPASSSRRRRGGAADGDAVNRIEKRWWRA